jgi:hypothetical protein
MKVRVADLKPNPYRRIENYPIRREKVEALKNSIRQTSFWDNVVARKNGGILEIAYGHHRLVALKELGIKEVDIPVKDIDDATMLRIMANENMDDWEADTRVINETVAAVRDFILKNQEKVPSSGGRPAVGKTEDAVLRFLGNNWKRTTVQDALAAIGDDDVDREAVEEFATPTHAQTFRRELKKDHYSGLFTKPEQKKVAREIREELEAEGEVTSEGIKRKVYEKVKEAATPDIRAKLKESKREHSVRYSACGAQWYKVLRAVLGVDVPSSDLTPAETEAIEKQFIAKIEQRIAHWRKG